LLAGLVAVRISRRRPRLRQVLRVPALALTGLVLVLWLSTLRYSIKIAVPFGYFYTSCGCYMAGFYAIPVEFTGGEVRRVDNPFVWWFRPLGGVAWGDFVPLWLPLLGMGIPAVLLCRRAGWPAGCCQRCGYDLRASPDRCPECGTETKPS